MRWGLTHRQKENAERKRMEKAGSWCREVNNAIPVCLCTRRAREQQVTGAQTKSGFMAQSGFSRIGWGSPQQQSHFQLTWIVNFYCACNQVASFWTFAEINVYGRYDFITRACFLNQTEFTKIKSVALRNIYVRLHKIAIKVCVTD